MLNMPGSMSILYAICNCSRYDCLDSKAKALMIL